MENSGFAGSKGESVRSDCFVSFTPAQSGGLKINLESKVKQLYGDSIEELCRNMAEFFGVQHGDFHIEDKGALHWVLAARIEHAIKQLVDTSKEYLPELIEENRYSTVKDRNRRSRLYLPGNTPKLIINAGIHNPDGIILDLEDAVAPNKKTEARLIVRNALRQVNFYGAERMVRINQLPQGLEDLESVVPHNVHVILIPKCESAGQVKQVAKRVEEILGRANDSIYFMPIIESALGVVHAYDIAASSEQVVALAIGLEDYTASIGAQRTNEGKESFHARSAVVNAAMAAGVQPIDSVFSDVSDMEALLRNVQESKSLGFTGMGCIHPRQIEVIHRGFAPKEIEIEQAKRIVLAFDEAASKGLGVVSVGSKMIDPPVVKRAHKVINLALSAGLLDENWNKQAFSKDNKT